MPTTFVVYVENGVIKLASNGYSMGLTGISVKDLKRLDGQDKEEGESDVGSPE